MSNCAGMCVWVSAIRSSSQLVRIASFQPASRSCASAGPTSPNTGMPVQVSTNALSPSPESSTPTCVGRAPQALVQHVPIGVRRSLGLEDQLLRVVGVEHLAGALPRDRLRRVAHAGPPVDQRPVAVERHPAVGRPRLSRRAGATSPARSRPRRSACARNVPGVGAEADAPAEDREDRPEEVAARERPDRDEERVHEHVHEDMRGEVALLLEANDRLLAQRVVAVRRSGLHPRST